MRLFGHITRHTWRCAVFILAVLTVNFPSITISQAQSTGPDASEPLVVDLSKINFSEYSREGKAFFLGSLPWEIWPNQILQPDELGSTAPARDALFNVWNVVNGPGAFTPRKGTFTARLKLKLPSSGTRLALVNLAVVPLKLFLNGIERFQVGVVGPTDTEVNDESVWHKIELPAGEVESEIVLQISYHDRGWLPSANLQLPLSTDDAFVVRFSGNRALQSCLAVASCLIAIFCLVVAQQTGQWRTEGLLFLSSIATAFNALLSFELNRGDFTYYHLSNTERFLTNTINGFAIGHAVAVGFAVLALRQFMRLSKPDFFIDITLLLIVPVTIFDVIFRGVLVELMNTWGSALFVRPETLLGMLSLTGVVVAGLRGRRPHAKTVAAFFVPIITGTILEFYLGKTFIQANPAASLAPLAMGFLLIYLLIDDFVSARDHALTLASDLDATNSTLERTIEARTQSLREAQGQLVHAEKMAALGTLVAGVAHEINTPLGIAVTAATQVISDRDNLEAAFDSNKISRSVLSEFLGAAKVGMGITYANLVRAADLVSSFKQVAVDQNSEEARLINLSVYVDSILRSLGPITRQGGVQVINNIPSEITVTIAPGALAQIVTNLVQNATIHAFQDIVKPKVTVSAAINDATIRLTVTDNGVGMSDEVRAKAFDPFFTTKRGDGGGTGLGLHIVHNLVTEALKGSLELKSKLGEGTEFAITLNGSSAAT